MKELAILHDKHMNRPTLDDSSEEEHAIEITTQEITQVQLFTSPDTNMMFTEMHAHVGKRSTGGSLSSYERR